MSIETPLVFTHFGCPSYLEFTLRSARRSNPGMRMVLLGDDTNVEVARDAGWEHAKLHDFRSERRDEFNARFRWIQGLRHNPVRGRGDWLRYVFERFFVLEEFLRVSNIERFWHFDSDTMILHALTRYEDKLKAKNLACTELCSGLCPSGFLSTKMVSDFCTHIIEIFNNEEMLTAKQKEIDQTNPRWAFTEMAAFVDYRQKYKPSSAHLACLFSDEGVWFDDCICNEDGFQMGWAGTEGAYVKELVRKDKIIFCDRGGVSMEFATINCSWVSTNVFQWIEGVASGNGEAVPQRLCGFLALSRSERFRRLVRRLGRRVVTSGKRTLKI